MLQGKELAKFKNYVSGLDNDLPLFFDALGDSNRYKIFVLLLGSKKDICVTDFADIFNISVPAASQQLKGLEMSGLIERVRHGQTTCYEVKHQNPKVKSIIRTIKEYI